MLEENKQVQRPWTSAVKWEAAWTRLEGDERVSETGRRSERRDERGVRRAAGLPYESLETRTQSTSRVWSHSGSMPSFKQKPPRLPPIAKFKMMKYSFVLYGHAAYVL